MKKPPSWITKLPLRKQRGAGLPILNTFGTIDRKEIKKRLINLEKFLEINSGLI